MFFKRSKLLAISCQLLALLALTACAGGELLPPPEAPAPVHVWIGIEDGAGRLGEIIDAQYPAGDDLVLHLLDGSRIPLLDDLEAGVFDAVFVHQLPPNADTTVWYSPVALDGLAVVVHPDNPLTGLTRQQVQGLFSGEIGRWTAAGGPDLPVEPLLRETGDSGRLLFRERILAERPAAVTAPTLAGHDLLLDAVAANPAAVGYAMMGGLDERVKPLHLETLLPDRNTTGTQQYLLTTPIYFVALEEPHGPARALLAWLQSPAGQEQVGEVYGRVR